VKPSELLADPKAWTKRAYARDKDGHTLLPDSTGAVCWCLKGALCKTLGGAKHHAAQEALRRHVGFKSIFDWNDDPKRKHSEVIAALVAVGL
jgi:hypothetical protein